MYRVGGFETAQVAATGRGKRSHNPLTGLVWSLPAHVLGLPQSSMPEEIHNMPMVKVRLPW